MDEIIRLAVLLIAAICGRYLVPFLKSKIDAEKLTIAITWAGTFVRAAEQLITGEKMGEERKKLVEEKLQEKLKEKNIDMTVDDIDALIEEAVNLMNGDEK